MVFRGIVALLLAPILTAIASTPAHGADCPRAREFITTLEFLRQDTDLKVPEAQGRKLASQVAAGCAGAAQRFIRVAKLLNASGLGGRDAIETALPFSERTDAETDTFIVVFRHAFVEEFLDLDLKASIDLARSLSSSFEGDVLAARDDFEKLIQFCVSPRKLDLPKPLCAGFAADTARIGSTKPWGSGGVAAPFIQVYEFLRSDTAGPALGASAALNLTREIISRGPDSSEGFMAAYRYASAKKGLDLARAEAISFARDLAGDAPGRAGSGRSERK